jgi:protein tyrosine phosphatase (PTP) superfamily phosphohydrolase (DUF442 family)
MASGWWRKLGARLAFLAALSVAGDIAWKLDTANFAVVVPGRIYRSAQMDAKTLRRVLRERAIKTVLNLRGPHPDQAWYRAERATTIASGATQIDVAMSSCEWMSRAQLREVLHILDSCEYPLLIHCQHGAERTGLGSAIVQLLRPGVSLAEARRQFSWRYLFLPIKNGMVMLEHFDSYARWLRDQHLDHSPVQFRRWVAEGFHPNHPGREDWPYDPYPLAVITRPGRVDGERLAAQRGQSSP